MNPLLKNLQIQMFMAKDVCNSLVRSLFFEIELNEKRVVDAFLVASDKDSDKFLIEVPVNLWLDYIRFVSKDYVVYEEIPYDESDRMQRIAKRGSLGF